MAKTKTNKAGAVGMIGAAANSGQTTIDQINGTPPEVINVTDNADIENNGTLLQNRGEQGDADQGNIKPEENNGEGNINPENNGITPESGTGGEQGGADQDNPNPEGNNAGGDGGSEISFEDLDENVDELVLQYQEATGNEFKPSDLVTALKMMISLAKGDYVIIPAKDGSENIYAQKPADTNQVINTELADVEDQVFAGNPKLTEYFKTVDGQPFYTDAAAKNHAKGLEDKTVTKITKG